MSRPLRITFPGAFYHVTSRGNERRSIFQSGRDFERFAGYLESATERYGAVVHCFCLMANHYHLLLETPRANLEAILHHLNTGYTDYFNIKRGRSGHLFQGRYKAILVEKDSYALELSRYIHLNPVRAQIVKDPSEYTWSSYVTYIGRERSWDWLCEDFILGQLSEDKQRAYRRYRDYVKEAVGRSLQDPLQNTVASTMLGSDRFVEWVKEKWLKKARPDRDIPALRRLTNWPELSLIARETDRVFGRGTSEARKIAIYLSHRLSGLMLGEIGEYYKKISPSAVSQNTRRMEERLKEESELSKKVHHLKEMILSNV